MARVVVPPAQKPRQENIEFKSILSNLVQLYLKLNRMGEGKDWGLQLSYETLAKVLHLNPVSCPPKLYVLCVCV